MFIDKRDEEDAQNMLDMQTVSESAPHDHTPADDDTINGTRQLMKETSKIHKMLLQATQDSKKFTKLDRDDPHEEAEDQKMLRLGYRYKIYKLAANITICVRCANHFKNPNTLDGVSNLFVLLEWNQSRQGWTKDLDANLNTKLNTEIIDNTNKMSRWAIQSILGGVDRMRFAFVQRVDVTSNKAHKAIGFTSQQPETFINQLNMKMSNCWAILKDLLSTVLTQEQTAADYLYMKDPSQYNYRLYYMVKTENEGEDDDDSDETGL